MPTREELAYIAGLFDGEGCMQMNTSGGRNGKSRQYRVQISQKHPMVLYWIVDTLNLGRVYTFKSGCSRWEAASKSAITFLRLIVEFSIARKENIKEMILCYEEGRIANVSHTHRS